MHDPVCHVAVQWPRFGPYHLARLRGAFEVLEQLGIQLTSIETTRLDDVYAWREESESVPFRRVRLFDRIPDRPALVRDAMWQMLDQVSPDVVAINSYGQTDALSALAWCRAHRRAAVMMNESKADDAIRRNWRETLKGYLVRLFDAGLVGGTPQERYYQSLGLAPERLFRGYDVVDHDFFATRAEAARTCPYPSSLPREPYFLASSRFLRRKNMDGLLRAYIRYRARTEHPWALVILGDGAERPHLERLAAQTEAVYFAGFQQIDALPSYYAHAAAFVHPALNDQWGLVVNEAAAAGLPLLVTNRTGAAEDLVCGGWNGLTFPPIDEAISEALLRVSSLPEAQRRLWGKRSAERSKAAFTPLHFGEGLLQAARAAAAHAATRRGQLDVLAGHALWSALRFLNVQHLHTVGEA